MYDFHISDMAQAVVDALSEELPLHQNDALELKPVVRDALSKYWVGKIALTWTIDDVLAQAKESGKELSTEQAYAVLDKLLHKHDASEGVNWHVIQAHIDMLDW